MSEEYVKDYEDHIMTVHETFYKIKEEAHRRDGFKILRLYLEKMYD